VDDSRTKAAEADYHAAHVAFLAIPRPDREALRIAFDVRERARTRWLAELDAAADNAQDAPALEDALTERQRALTLLRAHGELPPLEDVLVEVSLGEATLARIGSSTKKIGCHPATFAPA
jgi:hypothetical protein